VSTTPDPTGLTALIVGDAPVVHAAEAVHYNAPDLGDTTDGTDDVVLPVLEATEDAD